MNTKRAKFCIWLQRKIYPKRKRGLIRPVLIRFLWAALHPLWWYVNIKQELIKYDLQYNEFIIDGKRYSRQDIDDLDYRKKGENYPECFSISKARLEKILEKYLMDSQCIVDRILMDVGFNIKKKE
jgi:hypothetical protein